MLMEGGFELIQREVGCAIHIKHGDDAGVILNIADTELYTEKLHHLTCFNDISNLGIGKLCNGCAFSRRCLYQTKRNQAVDCSKDRGAADAQ